MSNINEFKGKTEEAITTVKQDIAEVKTKIEAIDKRIWLIVLLMSILVGDKLQGIGNVVGSVLAWGK